MWYKYATFIDRFGKLAWVNTGRVAHGPKPADGDGEKWVRPWEVPV